MIENPTGDVYLALIKALCKNSDRFCFVTRKELDYDQLTIQLFQPHKIREYKSKQWSGTVTRGPSATIHEYKINKETTRLLLQSANSLYEWVSPKLPEDLAFYQKDFNWFYSTTHEELADFRICSEQQVKLMEQIPGLKVEKAEY